MFVALEEVALFSPVRFHAPVAVDTVASSVMLVSVYTLLAWFQVATTPMAIQTSVLTATLQVASNYNENVTVDFGIHLH